MIRPSPFIIDKNKRFYKLQRGSMTYNYGKQIRVCSKVSYIWRENNDAGDLSLSPGIGKIIDSLTSADGVEVRAHTIMKDSDCTCLRASGSSPGNNNKTQHPIWRDQ